jgi:hypothetical protein
MEWGRANLVPNVEKKMLKAILNHGMARETKKLST